MRNTIKLLIVYCWCLIYYQQSFAFQDHDLEISSDVRDTFSLECQEKSIITWPEASVKEYAIQNKRLREIPQNYYPSLLAESYQLQKKFKHPQVDSILPLNNRNQHSIDEKSTFEQFNPLLSAAVIRPKHLELILYNIFSLRSLTTERSVSEIIRTDQTSFGSFLQINYGLAHLTWLNLGLDLQFLHVSNQVYSDTSNTGNGSNEQKFNGLRSIGPRIRILPFRRIPELIVLSAVHIPGANSEIKRSLLGSDRIYWQNQFLFYQHILPRFTLQLQTEMGIHFENKDRKQTWYVLGFDIYGYYKLILDQLYLLGSFSYKSVKEKSVLNNSLRELSFEQIGSIGLYWQTRNHKLALNASISIPLDYKLNSKITSVNSGSWWIYSLGIRYPINLQSKNKLSSGKL